jgi:hypothetical protein
MAILKQVVGGHQSTTPTTATNILTVHDVAHRRTRSNRHELVWLLSSVSLEWTEDGHPPPLTERGDSTGDRTSVDKDRLLIPEAR